MAKGKCATGKIADDPYALLVNTTVGDTVTSVKFSPAGSLKQGRQKLKVSVKYAGGATAKASCDVDVSDREPPTVSVASKSGGACAWPKPGKTAACYPLKELVRATDNCRPAPTVTLTGCAVTASAPSNGSAADCYQESGAGSVCVVYPPAGAVAPRVARVSLRAVDASKNSSPALNVSVVVYGAKPASPPQGCKPR
ncbi:hypothetical protein MNEG_2719 [Monoraphidium neglectum]|jgi:hypothetical protein|uniref:Uncharacterized protein n=1 Tax=Monoraphidium neglectum TaxID=145388 RepID=A0A0D2LEZ5_9CHLO|nr:hypothetical protein MNEG_2719 [Monoraphidium neglectum]KIZ05239.1 hypothetical protein MNEG_2719 [Monoraphidium neglectum]|eukprot:XP_013904258.1 hypothetical protein MNEG_2719 [Monoraphidium neglectum]